MSPNAAAAAARLPNNLAAVVKPIMSTQLEAPDQMRRRGGRQLEGEGEDGGVQPTLNTGWAIFLVIWNIRGATANEGGHAVTSNAKTMAYFLCIVFTTFPLCSIPLTYTECVRDVLHPYLILNGEEERKMTNLLARVDAVRVRVWSTSKQFCSL